MHYLTHLFEFLHKWGWLAASALGALIGMSFVDRLTFRMALLMFAAGVGFAVLTAPIVAYMIDPPEVIKAEVIAALAGLFSLVGFILIGGIVESAHAIRAWMPGAVRRILKRKEDRL